MSLANYYYLFIGKVFLGSILVMLGTFYFRTSIKAKGRGIFEMIKTFFSLLLSLAGIMLVFWGVRMIPLKSRNDIKVVISVALLFPGIFLIVMSFDKWRRRWVFAIGLLITLVSIMLFVSITF